MKFNKKFLTIFVGIFAFALVSAVAVSYLYSQEVSIFANQVEIDGGEASQQVSCDIGATCYGDEVILTNDLEINSLMSLTSENDEGASTKYVSTLTLAKKVVDFGNPIWDLVEGVEAESIEVEYTVAGSSFSAEVVGEGKTGYVLIYYADNDDRFAYPGEAVLIEDVAGNLPAVDDENADLNDYSAEYPTTPFGAKIWYVPENALDEGVIDWTRASEFLFETKLVQYNSEGDITLYPTQVLSVTPGTTIEAGLPEGIYNATANIARLA